MEADSDSFADVFANFQRFLTSVSYGTGG
jgi:hypothetical protein